jgi:glucose dehydrogenase
VARTITTRHLAAAVALCAIAHLEAQPRTTWSDYGGGPDAAQYSGLRQIDRSNVDKLQVAWTYPTADGRKYAFNPLVVDGLMYVLGKNNSIIALDAATGKEIWVRAAEPDTSVITSRGINYWESADKKDRRLSTAASTSKQVWTAILPASAWSNPLPLAACSRISSFSVPLRIRDTDRRRATYAPTTSARANSSGPFTPCLVLESSGTTRGRRTRGNA